MMFLICKAYSTLRGGEGRREKGKRKRQNERSSVRDAPKHFPMALTTQTMATDFGKVVSIYS